MYREFNGVGLFRIRVSGVGAWFRLFFICLCRFFFLFLESWGVFEGL